MIHDEFTYYNSQIIKEAYQFALKVGINLNRNSGSSARISRNGKENGYKGRGNGRYDNNEQDDQKQENELDKDKRNKDPK